MAPSKSGGSMEEKSTDQEQGSGDGSFDELEEILPKPKRKRGRPPRAAGLKECDTLFGLCYFTHPCILLLN